MQINIDCVRDLLLVIDELFVLDTNGNIVGIPFYKIAQQCPKYSKPELKYTLQEMNRANFITLTSTPINNMAIMVHQITKTGYYFLEITKPNENCQKLKTAFSKLAVPTLSALIQAAPTIIETLI